jgi:hypothetical protein
MIGRTGWMEPCPKKGRTARTTCSRSRRIRTLKMGKARVLDLKGRYKATRIRLAEMNLNSNSRGRTLRRVRRKSISKNNLIS